MHRRLKFSHIEVSYLEAAPDHGQPEIAVVFPKGRKSRVVPVAVGEEAKRLWKYPPGEEGFLALAYASAEVVSPRGKPAAGLARRDFPLGKAEARRQAIHRIRRDKVSQGKRENPATKHPAYPAPAGALAAEPAGGPG